MQAVLLRVAALSCGDGFEWLVLGGLPQLLALYPDGVDPSRAPGDIDLLVPHGRSGAVSNMLAAAGFTEAGRAGATADLGRLALRADRRVTLIDQISGLPVHLHERLFFADATIGPLLHTYRPRRSRTPDDICAPPVGAPMALDILLRGNARRWAKRDGMLDLAAVLRRLDAGAQEELLRAIEAAQVVPAAHASLAALPVAIGAVLPERFCAWLDQAEPSDEVSIRLTMYQEAMAGPAAPESRPAQVAYTPPPSRSLAARIARRFMALVDRRRGFTPVPATRLDRYPLAFRFARHWFEGRKDLRILSYGCSTGEEVLTLRRYLPGATIKGIDVDARAIASARALTAGERDIMFEVAATTAGEPERCYDAIFCMAVLRDPRFDLPATRRATGRLTFAAFEAEIDALLLCLKPGGLLFIAHGNFRVRDTTAAARLEVVLHGDPPRSGLTPGLYDAANARMTNVIDRALGFTKVAR